MKRLSIVLMIVIALLMAACSAAPVATQDEATEAPTIEATQASVVTDEPTEVATAEPTEAAAEGFPVTVVDGLGKEITVEAAPQRIASVTLGTDEILLDLVGPERMVGVTFLAADETTSNIADNPALAEVPNVIPATPSAEQIIALEPDLVFVGSFTDQALIEQLEAAGLTVFAVGFFNSIEAMQQNIVDIGTLVGEVDAAQNLVEVMNDRLAVLEEVLAQREGEEPATVLYYASGGWVAGSATTTDDIITRAGGINAAAESGIVDWAQISEETLIEMNPDVVIVSPYVTDEEFLTNPVYAGLDAVINGRVYSISDACMSATSQYIVCGVEDAAHVIYPELFGE